MGTRQLYWTLKGPLFAVLSATSAQLLVRIYSRSARQKSTPMTPDEQSALHNLSRDCKSKENKNTITGLATDDELTFSVFLRQG
jgi:hypothetical protein